MKTILNPTLYHGSKKKNNFFEGWYFKVVDKNNLYKFAFIPGIALGENDAQHHSFVQIVDCYNVKYDYLRFSKNDFYFNNNHFKIGVNSNIFSLDGIELNLQYTSNSTNKNTSMVGNLKFTNIVNWPDSIINPGSMGFYNYLIFMECYSQVCALDGDITGKLNINGESIDFTGGKVYIEKNWGTSFPKSWLWVQSNSFPDNKVSVTCSLATIPFPIKDFRGFLIGVTVGNKFYSFTTINRSKLTLKKLDKDIVLTVTKENLSLTLKTFTSENDFVLCMGPKNGDMIPLVKETLSGKVEMILKDTKNNNILYSGVGQSTGVEYGGDMMHILN